MDDPFYTKDAVKFIRLEGLVAAALNFKAVPSDIGKVLKPAVWNIISNFFMGMIEKDPVIHLARQKLRSVDKDNSHDDTLSKSAGRKPVPTLTLLESEKEKRAKTEEGRRFRSKAVSSRLHKQSEALKDIATNIHHGSKTDLIHTIATSVSRCKTIKENSSWDGNLSVDDIILMNKLIQVPKSDKSLYELLTKVKSAEEYFLSAEDILYIKGQASSCETFRYLRRKFPGFFASEAREDQLKKKWHNEFRVILKPERTATGWKVDIDALQQLLRFRYHWLPEEEWWRLYMDARNYGGSKTCTIEISPLNNECMLNDVGFHSPDHYWPVHLIVMIQETI